MSRAERFSLDTVTGMSDDGYINVGGLSVSLEDYSRFKHGDGDVAVGLGTRLADTFADKALDTDGKNILITSSAYKTAPPASNALVDPFVSQLKNRLTCASIEQFKINRTVLTQGDYASMPLELREEVMKKNGLKIPEEVDVQSSDTVIALDDILVTGSHEVSIEKLFDRSEVQGDRYYAYILRVGEGVSDPRIEAAINHCAIKSLSDVVAMANDVQNFMPNARLAKMVVSSSEDEIDHFTNEIEDVDALEMIHEYIVGDELDIMPGYQTGAQLFTSYLRRR